MSENVIYDKPNLRLTIEGILYKMRVGCPWRDLPSEYGPWNTIYKKFNDWSSKSKIMSIFKALINEPDLEWKMIDGTVIHAHQHAAGSRKGKERAIGKSAGGRTSKIHMVTDSHGNPIEFEITEGQVHDVVMAADLIKNTPISKYTLGDKGYDSDHFRDVIKQCKSIPAIPKRKNSKKKLNDFDRHIYKQRFKVENLFGKLKQNRSIATRFEKLKINFIGMVSLACAYIWLRL